MKTILFATDFTDTTTRALDWAKLFARQYGATLVLIHAQPVPVADTSLTMAGTPDMGLVNPLTYTRSAELIDIDQERLDDLAGQVRAEGITCQTELRWGNITDTLITATADLHADLLVIGRGHLDTFFERLVGTEATGVAQGAHCPVLMVPIHDDTPAQLQTILFSTSLEFDQPTEFGQLVDLARVFGATLSVVHVHAENQPSMTDTALMIAQLQQLYGATPLRVDTVSARTVTGGVETYLETHRPDLLVMTNRERGFLSGLLNPSLTGRMVGLSKGPLLVYHAKGDL